MYNHYGNQAFPLVHIQERMFERIEVGFFDEDKELEQVSFSIHGDFKGYFIKCPFGKIINTK